MCCNIVVCYAVAREFCIDSLAKFSQQTVLLLKVFLLFKMTLNTYLFYNSKMYWKHQEPIQHCIDCSKAFTYAPYSFSVVIFSVLFSCSQLPLTIVLIIIKLYTHILSIFISPLNIINVISRNAIHRHILFIFFYSSYLIIIGINSLSVYVHSFLL